MLTMDALKPVAVVVGLVLAASVILPAAWVWYRRQIFGYGGSVLILSGVTLSGLSIWSNIRFSVSPTEGIEMQLSELKQQLKDFAASGKELASSVQGLDQSVALLQSPTAEINQKLAALQEQLNTLRAPKTERASQVQGSDAQPSIVQPSGYTPYPDGYGFPEFGDTPGKKSQETELTSTDDKPTRLADGNWRVTPRHGVAKFDVSFGKSEQTAYIVIRENDLNQIKAANYQKDDGSGTPKVSPCLVLPKVAVCTPFGAARISVTLDTTNDFPLEVEVLK